MAAPFGNHPTLAALVEKLESLGCTISELSGEIVGPDGPFRVRYAVNPENGKYLVLPNETDGTRLSPWIVGNVERRLGLKTGFSSL